MHLEDAKFIRIRFPGGLLFGAMVASAVLHGSGLIHAVMPWWVANTAMIALGAVTGEVHSRELGEVVLLEHSGIAEHAPHHAGPCGLHAERSLAGALDLLAVLVNDLHPPNFGIIELFEPFFNLGLGALSVMDQPMLAVSCYI